MMTVPLFSQDFPLVSRLIKSPEEKKGLWSILVTQENTMRSQCVFDLSDDFDVSLERMNIYIRSRQYEDAVFVANHCIELAVKNCDTLQLVQANRLKASALRRSGNLQSADPIYKATIEVAQTKGYIDEAKILLNSHGALYVLTAEYDKALGQFLKSLPLRERGGNKDEIGTCLHNLGLIYYKLNNFNKAIEYYKKSLGVKGIITPGSMKSLINIGLCYSGQRDYEEGLRYVKRGLKLCQDRCSHDIYTEAKFALGMIYYYMQDCVMAERFLLESLSTSRITQDNRFIAENLIYLARVFLDNGDLQKTYNYLTEARHIAAKHGFNELRLDTYRVFISFYERKGDVAQLADYYLKYNALREEMQGRGLLQRVSAFEVEMEHEENLKTLAYQSNVVALQTNLLVSQRRIYFGITALFGLIGIIFFLVWRKNVQKAKVNALLERLVIHRINRLNSKAKISVARNKQLTEGLRNRIESVNILIQILGSSLRKSVTNKIYGVQFESVVEQMVILNSYHDVHFLDGIESLQTYD
ncbi:MAG TPA: tetratricopeptide repeat protein [Ohtaekwangia sp.]|nr:tetratricopeptide repeat protein [Ohtaekwangia sp.]